MKKRHWKKWPKRFKGELDGTASVIGVVGLGTAIAGSIFAGPVALVAGALALVGTVSFACIRSYPPLAIDTATVVGQSLNPILLEQLVPIPKKIAIVGSSKSGKSTLLARLRVKRAPTERTQEITATIISLGSQPIRYVAVLDGSGETYTQQFRIAENGDIIILMFDHNGSDSSKRVLEKRLVEHTAFSRQLREHLTQTGRREKSLIHILANKMDLWSQSAKTRQSKLTKICEDELGHWKTAGLAKKTSTGNHSNNEPDSASVMMDLLRNSVTVSSD